MKKKVFTKDEITVAQYAKRNEKREHTLITSTMDMVGYFMGLGDDQATADGKVKQISDEVALHLYPYVLGRTQPLIDAVNDMDDTTYPFMDASAKSHLTTLLSV